MYNETLLASQRQTEESDWPIMYPNASSV